jgi:hypothetical protein
MRRFWIAPALAALLFGGPAACGDDGGDTATDSGTATDDDNGDTITLAEWVDEADATCATGDTLLATLDRPEAGPFSDELDDEDFEEIAVFLDELAAVQQQILDAFRELPEPDEDADEVEEFLDTMQSYIDDLEAAAEAARDGDADELAESFADSAERRDEAADQADALGLGVPQDTISVCGDPDPIDSAPTGNRTGTGE